MRKFDLMEGEEVEFKQQWTDRALKDLAAFANTRGGTLLIGVRMDGQVQAVLHVKARGSIGNKEYRGLTGASKPTVTRDLEGLLEAEVLVREGGRGRGTRYRIKGSEWAQERHKGIIMTTVMPGIQSCGVPCRTGPGRKIA